MPLYTLSRTVRYLAAPGQWVPSEKIDKEVFGRFLAPIELSVQKLMALTLNLPKLLLAVPVVPAPSVTGTPPVAKAAE